MSVRRVAFVAGGLVAVFWIASAALPAHPRQWSSLDLRWHYYYIYEAFYTSLRRAPMLWNPWQLCGMPWLATLQGGFFYPPHLLYVVLPTYHALALSTVLHLCLAAATMAAFARQVGLSAPASVLAALVFSVAGPVRDWQLWPALLESISWLPLGALGVVGIARGYSWHGGVVLALSCGASWLAGFPQASVLSIYTWSALLGALVFQSRPGWRQGLRHGGFLIVALGFGACLGAVALAPAVELARNAVRPTAALPTGFLYPFGVPGPRAILISWAASGRALIIVAIVLSPLALIAGPLRRFAFAACLIGGVVAGIALGPGSPLFALYPALPVLGWFRVPHRMLVVSQFFLALIAAVGTDELRRRLGDKRVASGLAAIVIFALGKGLSADPLVPNLPYEATALPWDPAVLRAYSELAREIDGGRVWPFSPDISAAALPPKLPTLAELRSIEEYEPLTLRRQSEYFVYFVEGSTQSAQTRFFNGHVTSVSTATDHGGPGRRRRLLDLAAVRFVMTPSPVLDREDFAAFLREAELGPPRRLAPRIELFENPHVVPRAFVTYRTEPAPPTEILLRRLADPNFDPFDVAYVESDAARGPSTVGQIRGHAATILSDTAQMVEIAANLSAPGIVVLADTYDSSWVATIDDFPASILPTNHLFRGVLTPAGRHRVRFVYRPRALWLGGAVTLSATLCLIGAAILSRRAHGKSVPAGGPRASEPPPETVMTLGLGDEAATPQRAD